MGLFFKRKKGAEEQGRFIDRQRSKIQLLVPGIFILVILAGSLDYPILWDKGADWINSNIGIKIPHFYKLPFRLGLDLQGGTHLVYEADLSNIEAGERDPSLEGIRDVIERRVNLFGVSEPIVQVNKAAGSYRLIVDLPGVTDVHEAIRMIGATPYLEFKEQREQAETDEILKKQQAGDEQAQKMDPYFKSTQLTGRYLKKSQLAFDQTTNKAIVSLEFTDEGGNIFADLTKKNVNKILAIYLDGAPISTPRVQEEITGGKAQITGNFTINEAKELAQRLNAGALPVPINLISQQNIGASLGHDSLVKSLKAGLIGFLAILLFMIIFYRFSGFFASVSLIIYVILVLAIFKLVPVTLTLAGIAGFLLSMGMAVDANILIFSRTKEELKEGRNYFDALNNGIRRAWPSIRDGNFTTILVGLILFIFGTSFVKGFALTLILGNVINMFSAIVITNYLIRFFLGLRAERIRRFLL
ncbi:MAG: protein translocase subunit SecD [Patescibacteria group bacterium]